MEGYVENRLGRRRKSIRANEKTRNEKKLVCCESRKWGN
jgi:hypothetical protein